MTVPATLLALQDSFTQTIREPLIDDSATILGRDLSRGMTAYHRQYWMRLFTVLQGQFPLLCALIGAAPFNVLAQDYLLAHPPAHRDLGEIPMSFCEFAASELAERERTGLEIDYAFWHCFRAPVDEPLQVEASEIGGLATQTLEPRASVRIVWEAWNLMEVRARDEDIDLVKLAEPAAWVVYRAESSIRFERLATMEAKVLTWMAKEPLGGALARAQEQMDAARLAENVGAWLARAVSRNHWRAR